MKKKKNVKKTNCAKGSKKLLIAACALAVFLVIIVVAGAFLLPGLLDGGKFKENPTPAITGTGELDDSDLFRDEKEYLKLFTDIFFEYGGMGTYITDDNYLDFEDQAQFFKFYIDSVMDGDVEAYLDLFAPGFFEEDEKISFNPQKLYDISITFNSENTNITLGDVTYNTVENFTVKYKIFNNDKTFRSDMPSDAVKPQVIQIALVNGEYKIINIINPLVQ